MDIEIKERRWIKCSSLKKKRYSRPNCTFVKNADREEMKVEGEKVKKTRKHHKFNVINNKTKTRWYKTYMKKRNDGD